MRALLWLLTLAALATGIALLGRLSEGYVLWVVPPWRIETSFNLFVVAQLVLLLAAYLLLRGIVQALNLPRVVSAYRERRARQRDERAAVEALRLFWEGRYGHALKSAEKVGAGETAGPAQGVAALVGLKAAHALRDPVRIALWEERARAQDAAGWRTARLMAEMRIALDAHDLAAAAAALEQLGTKERRRISVQRLALRLAQGRGDWTALLRLARLLEKHGALTAVQAQPLRLVAYHGMLDKLLDDPAQLVRLWRGMTAADRRDARLARRTAQALATAGACAESAELIEDFLEEQWDSSLLAIYADCPGGDALARIAHAEKWLHQHPNDAELLLALGRLSLQQQLWGKAQSYFEASLAVAPSIAAHLELARLLDRLGYAEEANRHYRAAAQFAPAPAQTQSRGGRKSV